MPPSLLVVVARRYDGRIVSCPFPRLCREQSGSLGPRRPSALGYWIGGAVMAAAVVGAAIRAAFAFFRRQPPPAGAAGPGIRDFRKTLPSAPVAAAAFGARLGHPLADGAAHSIGRRLRRRGCQLAARSQGLVGDGRVRAVARGRTRMGQGMRRHTCQATGASPQLTPGGCHQRPGRGSHGHHQPTAGSHGGEQHRDRGACGEGLRLRH